MTDLSISRKNVAMPIKANHQVVSSLQTRPQMRSGDMMNTLGLIGRIKMANVTFGSSENVKKYAGMTPTFSEKELDDRLGKEKTRTVHLLGVDAPEFKNLAEGDQKALAHLVKAADILDKGVQLPLDHAKNVEAINALAEAAAKGDTHAQKMHRLATKGMDGICAVDGMSQMTELFKEAKEEPGHHFYDPGTTVDDMKQYINKALDEGKKDHVQDILSARTIVRKQPDGTMKTTDYVDAFPDAFHAAADELDKAAKVSTNAQFNEYLQAQAQAFRKADPELDCKADQLWAKMQDTPLEFSITRENYDDRLTGVLVDDEKLNARFKEQGIDAQPKDSIGIRVGIVNKEGTDELYGYKKHLPDLAARMPFKDQYTQTISTSGEANQTMVDVDLVSVRGNVGAYRGGITIAENLPNDDKLSVKRGGGRRNVYHRQIRETQKTPEALENHQKFLDATLAPEFHKYLADIDEANFASHHITIGHENAHSLGPQKVNLGSWTSIIEESKADMGGLKDVSFLTKKGAYTKDQRASMLVDFCHGLLLKAKPKFSQAHRVRTVMQANYFIQEGAMSIDAGGRLHINMEKVVPTAKKMHKDLIALQLSQDPKKAGNFVKKWFVWGPDLQRAAANVAKVRKTIHGIVESPLAEKLLKEVR